MKKFLKIFFSFLAILIVLGTFVTAFRTVLARIEASETAERIETEFTDSSDSTGSSVATLIVVDVNTETQWGEFYYFD